MNKFVIEPDLKMRKDKGQKGVKVKGKTANMRKEKICRFAMLRFVFSLKKIF